MSRHINLCGRTYVLCMCGSAWRHMREFESHISIAHLHALHAKVRGVRSHTHVAARMYHIVPWCGGWKKPSWGKSPHIGNHHPTECGDRRFQTLNVIRTAHDTQQSWTVMEVQPFKHIQYHVEHVALCVFSYIGGVASTDTILHMFEYNPSVNVVHTCVKTHKQLYVNVGNLTTD